LKDNIFYVHAPDHDGLYILDLDCNETHINSVDAKRCKLSDDNITYTWHCRLGHVGVKCMKKLHSDGILGSLDFDSFDTCESCLMGKMTRTPFTRFVERATNLLGIIHTDVYGPVSVPTCNFYRYFVTFETFENFKEFQNEVKNQPDRKIKHLHFDRAASI
jgi:hypothetical protein